MYFRNGHAHVVKCLLADGRCDPNCTNKYGQSPLARTNNYDIITLLLQNGAVVKNLYEYARYLPSGTPMKVRTI